MPRARGPNRDAAYQLWKDSGGKMKLVDIAEKLGEQPSRIRKWKCVDKWELPKGSAPKRKGGGQPGNQNAKGHGGKPGNQNARKFGFYSYLPQQTRDIVEQMEHVDPLEILWHQICLSYAAILRAQEIAFVKDQQDKTRELVSETLGADSEMNIYDVQQAWDKQMAFMKGMSRAQETLSRLIAQYDKMVHANWEAATEEQKARLEQLRLNVEKLEREAGKGDGYDGIEIINDAPA